MAGHRAPRTAKGHDPLGLGSAPMRPWVVRGGDEGLHPDRASCGRRDDETWDPRGEVGLSWASGLVGQL